MNRLGAPLIGLLWAVAVTAAPVRGEDRPPEPAGYRTSDYRAPTRPDLPAPASSPPPRPSGCGRTNRRFLSMCCHARLAPPIAGWNALARQTAAQHSGQYLASRHRIRRTCGRDRRLPAPEHRAGHGRRPCQIAGDLLSAGLLDVVERRQAHPVDGFYQRRLVSGRHRRLDRGIAPPRRRATRAHGGRRNRCTWRSPAWAQTFDDHRSPNILSVPDGNSSVRVGGSDRLPLWPQGSTRCKRPSSIPGMSAKTACRAPCNPHRRPQRPGR